MQLLCNVRYLTMTLSATNVFIETLTLKMFAISIYGYRLPKYFHTSLIYTFILN